MALIGGPKLVIFDEPTTALDVTTQIEVLRAFKSVMGTGGMAGVYVSHDLAVVAQIADRIVVLRGGEVQNAARPRPSSRPRRTPTPASCSRPSTGPHAAAAPAAAAPRQPVLEVRDIVAATARPAATACRPRSPSATSAARSSAARTSG